MANKEFESANLMQQKKLFNQYHVYYIDTFHTEYNNSEIATRYVADRKIVLDKFTTIKENTKDYIIFEFNFDGTPRQLKGFKTKEAAQRIIP